MSRIRALQYYVLTRLMLAPMMVWTIATIVFLLLRATPGDPIDAILGPKAQPEQKEQLRQQLGLSDPIWLQYAHFMWGLLRLDFGTSMYTKGQSSVWSTIWEKFPATAELTVFSMAIALLIGITVGVLTGSRPNTPLDAGGRIFGIITYSLPIFWVGMMLQLVFVVGLRWLPVGGRYPVLLDPPAGPTGLLTLDSLLAGNFEALGLALYHLALPSLTLGIVLSGVFERIVRVNLKQSLHADYVEAARARGIPERRVLLRHALKNALIPVVTVLGLTLASMLGGSVLTEITFDWHGLGSRLIEATDARDYPMVQGIIVFLGIIVVVASIAIDIINAIIDPRIRY